ncbi:MAG TPA: sugar ABC transporter ATP-binding protein [Bacillota bacterium]|nr:sugar ABC transporter ATP-binding protein [Bacillota bacterium]
MESKFLFEMVEIWKCFGSNQVLKGVDFQVKPGEIHGLLGKNGAGKSLLMKILTGAVAKDAGTILYNGQPVEITSSRRGHSLGISMVYQDLSLFPNLTVAENIFIGRFHELGLVRHGLIDFDQIFTETKSILNKLHFDINPHTKVHQLGFSQQQMVEIARAISQNAELLILDEPMAALNERESLNVIATLREIQKLGVAIVFISHRINEIKALADQVTVLRDGKNAGSRLANTSEGEELLRMMVGEEALSRYPKLGLPTRKELLRIKNLSMSNILSNISLTLHEGEILGIAGLAGSGRTALVNAIFGMGSSVKGHIYLRGQEVQIQSPRQAIKLGFAYLAEDRTNSGLFANMSIKNNISATNLRRIAIRGIIDEKKETEIAKGLAKRLGIACQNLRQRVSTLSGGHQQKTLLAKWLYSGGYIYLLDEPTRGLDIASKVDLYNIINSLVCGGAGVIMISSDLSELIGMCHRVLVICKGSIAGELSEPDIAEDKILRLASGKES